MKNKNFSFKVASYLPEKSRISNLETQRTIVERAVKQSGNQKNLADFLEVAQTTVSSWKLGKTRIDLRNFRKLQQFLNEKSDVLTETHKGSSIAISEIELSSDLAWLIGIRHGDRDEDRYCIGVGTSDPEIAVEFIRIATSILKLSNEELWYQVTIPRRVAKEEEISEVRERYSEILGIPSKKLRVDTLGDMERHKKYHIVVRYFNTLVKQIMQNIEKDFSESILNSPKSVQGAYIAGLIDSEGGVKDSGRIVIEMRPKSFEILQLASKILKNLEINHSFVWDKKYNLVRITIYPNPKIMEFCNPIHRRKRAILSNALGMGQGFLLKVYLSRVSRS